MQIQKIIREKRLQKHYTQETLAKHLGVSTSAVNKWENDISYPDITILPALARALDTDLNTLLSFKEDLTTEEIGSFLNNLSEKLDQEGIAAVYNCAMDKIKEFPTCDSLIFNTVLFLDGAIAMSYSNEYDFTSIQPLYDRLLNSKDLNIQNSTKKILIQKYIQKQEYSQAEELLNTLSDELPIDKKQLQIQLYMAQGNLKEAATLEETQLYLTIEKLQGMLNTLMEIAIKDQRNEDALAIADISATSSKIFDLWEYTAYINHFLYYFAIKDEKNSILLLQKLLKSLKKSWKPNQSVLYQHMKIKEPQQHSYTKISDFIMKSLYNDNKAEFLKKNPLFKELLQDMQS